MTAFSGSALYLTWIYTGGSVSLTGDFRQFDFTPSLSLIDSTAGADTFREFIPGIGESGALSFSAVMQAGGTALIQLLATGTQGTVVYGPEGTAANKPKITIPAISKGPAYSQPYNDVVEFKVEWQQSAAHVNSFWP
jgi:hypothetical protein